MPPDREVLSEARTGRCWPEGVECGVRPEPSGFGPYGRSCGLRGHIAVSVVGGLPDGSMYRPHSAEQEGGVARHFG